jgi:hypothetical protein
LYACSIASRAASSSSWSEVRSLENVIFFNSSSVENGYLGANRRVAY